MNPRTFATRAVVVLIACMVVMLTGCKKPREIKITPQQKELIKANILSAVPQMQYVINANLDNRVKLLGVDVDKTTLKPGEDFTITYYWESMKELEGDWKVFVHLEQSNKYRQILDHDPVENLYPLDKFKKGEIVKDVQKVKLDGKFPGGTAVLYVGVFNEASWKQKQLNERLPVINAAQVKADSQQRINVLSFTVKGKPGAPGATAKDGAKTPKQKHRALTYLVRKATGPFTIDGKLDEADWAKARALPSFVSPKGTPLGPNLDAVTKALWDDKALYISMAVKDKDIATPYTTRDDTLWKADDLEIYLDPGKDGKDYLELQVSPANVVFDALFTSHRSPEWETAAKGLSLDFTHAVVVEGTIGDPKDVDTGYTLEVAIPFASIPGVGAAPKAGERWTVNFFRIEASSPGKVTAQSTWAPVGGDFHNLKDAGTFVFTSFPVDKLKADGKGAMKPPSPIEGLKSNNAPKVVPLGTGPDGTKGAGLKVVPPKAAAPAAAPAPTK